MARHGAFFPASLMQPDRPGPIRAAESSIFIFSAAPLRANDVPLAKTN
jgi:hypothetical protein